MSYGWDSSHWHWPQVAALCIIGFNLFIYAVLNGKPRTGEYNFALQLLSAAFSAWMLIAGGFFA
jgi:hypothetical protein